MASAEAGQRVRQARQSKGWTVTQLAQELDVPEYQVVRWEAGQRQPRRRQRRDLALALEVPYWSLWPPAEVAEGLTMRDARRVLLEARGIRSGGPHLYVNVRTLPDLAGAEHLADLWLAEDMGVEHGQHLYRLTGPGEEVRDRLLAELAHIHQPEPCEP